MDMVVLTGTYGCGLTSERINELIYPDSFGCKQSKDEPDWESIYTR